MYLLDGLISFTTTTPLQHSNAACVLDQTTEFVPQKALAGADGRGKDKKYTRHVLPGSNVLGIALNERRCLFYHHKMVKLKIRTRIRADRSHLEPAIKIAKAVALSIECMLIPL